MRRHQLERELAALSSRISSSKPGASPPTASISATCGRGGDPQSQYKTPYEPPSTPADPRTRTHHPLHHHPPIRGHPSQLTS